MTVIGGLKPVYAIANLTLTFIGVEKKEFTFSTQAT